MTSDNIEQLAINTIRTLSMMRSRPAKSGHPGDAHGARRRWFTPFGTGYAVRPAGPDLAQSRPVCPVQRPRFDAGLVHFASDRVQAVNADYEKVGKPSVTLDEIRRFRQLDSKAPGHPEYHWVSGVEATTGPLGQGVATQRRHGHRPKMARQPVQPARL